MLDMLRLISLYVSVCMIIFSVLPDFFGHILGNHYLYNVSIYNGTSDVERNSFPKSGRQLIFSESETIFPMRNS